MSDHGRICDDRLCKRLHCCISDNRRGFIQADQGKRFRLHPNLSHGFFQCCPYPMNIGNGPFVPVVLQEALLKKWTCAPRYFSDTDFCCRISNINSGNICQSRYLSSHKPLRFHYKPRTVLHCIFPTAPGPSNQFQFGGTIGTKLIVHL